VEDVINATRSGGKESDEWEAGEGPVPGGETDVVDGGLGPWSSFDRLCR
jgi:hypothetical protein